MRKGGFIGSMNMYSYDVEIYTRILCLIKLIFHFHVKFTTSNKSIHSLIIYLVQAFQAIYRILHISLVNNISV